MNKFIKTMVIIAGVFVLFFLVKGLFLGMYPIRYEEAVSTYAEKNDLPKNLVYAVIKAESNFKPEATSPKDAVGLMQILAPTGEWIFQKIGIENFNEEMLKNPDVNIEAGCYYLSYLLKRYQGNKKCALAAYNAGAANVDAWLSHKENSKNGTALDIIPFPETRQYVNQVLTNEKIYDFLYKN